MVDGQSFSGKMSAINMAQQRREKNAAAG